MSALWKSVQRLWTGYSNAMLRKYELRLIQRWGHVAPWNLKVADTMISAAPDDTIHSISVGLRVPPPLHNHDT